MSSSSLVDSLRHLATFPLLQRLTIQINKIRSWQRKFGLWMYVVPFPVLLNVQSIAMCIPEVHAPLSLYLLSHTAKPPGTELIASFG